MCLKKGIQNGCVHVKIARALKQVDFYADNNVGKTMKKKAKACFDKRVRENEWKVK